MAKGTLVDLDVKLGERILGFLDSARYPISAALWLWSEEYDEWRLFIATPLHDRSPGEAARQLTDAFPPEDRRLIVEVPITLRGNRSPFVRKLRSMFGKTASVNGMRLGGHRIGGLWVDDAYVYRIG